MFLKYPLLLVSLFFVLSCSSSSEEVDLPLFPPSPRLVVQGRLLDKNNRPLEGADITVVVKDPNLFSLLEELLFGAVDSKQTTDTFGAFALSLREGAYLLFVRRENQDIGSMHIYIPSAYGEVDFFVTEGSEFHPNGELSVEPL
ncbi:MAG: carboxypeptidase-like regulatory domain-containing protein [Spirochaetota bacterium]